MRVARLYTKATMMANEIKVIIPGWRLRSSGMAILQKWDAAVSKHDDGKEGRDELATRKCGHGEAEQPLKHLAIEEDGDREHKANPEEATKHQFMTYMANLCTMPCMLVVRRMLVMRRMLAIACWPPTVTPCSG